GVFDVRASFGTPTRVLMSEDLPTLERPAKAISGSVGGGNPDGRAAEMTNVALLGFMGAGCVCTPLRGRTVPAAWTCDGTRRTGRRARPAWTGRAGPGAWPGSGCASRHRRRSPLPGRGTTRTARPRRR